MIHEEDKKNLLDKRKKRNREKGEREKENDDFSDDDSYNKITIYHLLYKYISFDSFPLFCWMYLF